MNIFSFLTYDPVRDFDKRLPVRRKQTTTTIVQRTATTTSNNDNTYEAPNGTLYAQTTTTDNNGVTVFEMDSTDVRTDTNVKPGLTDYDFYVFGQFKANDTYKHFKLELYRLIKEKAYSKSIDGEPISYRQAAELPGIKGKKGCGSRYMANYFKAMNIAFQMEQNNAPIPSDDE